MRALVVIILCLTAPLLRAQNEKGYFVSAKMNGGILMAHRSSLVHLVRENQKGFELSFFTQYQDSSAMSVRLKQPIRGVSLSFIDFGYREVLGLGFGLTHFVKFPVLRFGKNLFLDYSMAAGTGVITKRYDTELNPKNNAIGSHLNARVDMEFSLTHYLKKFHYGIGVQFTHFSSGKLKHPNRGLNCTSLFVTTGYNFDERKRQEKNFGLDKKDHQQLYSNHTFGAEIIATAKEVGPVPVEAKIYPVVASRFSYVWRPQIKWGFETSTDIVYNRANQFYRATTDYSFAEAVQIGIYGGAIAYFRNSAVVFGGGVYLRDVIDVAGRIYNRLGFQQYFGDRFYALVAVKANFATADYFEFGVGYKIIRSE